MTNLLKKKNCWTSAERPVQKGKCHFSWHGWQVPYVLIVWPPITIAWETKLSKYKVPSNLLLRRAKSF